ncbi:TonB-dependent receptor [candidate division KSB1 bacterium]|nr:TonB-dependent receptor [candidate division KSB1 bacterium]RQW01197.1 MAG: TonB-dependent receptor [candidate division KSB1 bacterium]
MSHVNIVILGTASGAASDTNGYFRVDHLMPGTFSLKIMCMGYQTKIINNIRVEAGQTCYLNIKLATHVLPMREILITPGHFSIAQQQSVKQQAIEKERITAIPATLDDIYRVLHIMPGVSFSDDYSAHFHVRGGKQNENLILLDGMEIYDPYHLKNIGGAVGVMNMDLIDNMSLMTGGFPAQYGDRLSSVVAIENRPGSSERLRGSIVAGGTGFSSVIEGPIPFGSCILSFRKSFLKEAAEILNPTDYVFSPSFYDVQGKLAIAANTNNQIILNVLYSKDKSYLEKWRQDSELYADYGNAYQALVWKSTLSSKIFSEFILSRGENFWDNRVGRTKEEKLNLTENVITWNVNVHPKQPHALGCGITFKHIYYNYKINAEKLSQEQQELDEVVQSYIGRQTISPRTFKLGFYVQDEFQFFKPLYMNIGLRYDYFEYNNDQQVSPRVGISCHFKNKTILRAAWGNYYQSPLYTELTHIKGAEYNPKAARSIHYILGLEQFITENVSWRIEAYLKTLDHMIGHYFEMDDDSGHAQLKYGNPFSGQCRGIEFFINGKLSNNFSIWATYAYSKSTIETYFINWEKMLLEKQTVPRFTDQPHNLSLFFTYQIKSWELNIKWRYLSGMPYTPMVPDDNSATPAWRGGDYYSARYPAYHRLDVRIGKNFSFKYYQLAAFLEIKNLYNRKNVLLYDYRIENGAPVRQAFYTIPFLPTIECRISF